VAVPVDRLWDPPGANDLAEKLHVAGGVLLLAEQGGHRIASGVVDGADKTPFWPAGPQPVKRARIDLEQHPFGWHSFAPATVLRSPASRGRCHPGRLERAADRGDRELDPLPLGEKLGEVLHVGPVVALPIEAHDPGPGPGLDLLERWPSTVAMDQAPRAVPTQLALEPTRLPKRDVHHQRCLPQRDGTLEDPRKYLSAALFSHGHRDHVLFHGRTKSLIA